MRRPDPRGLAVGLLLVAAAGCGIPRDPEGTLERVRGGTLRVGVIEYPPWASLDPGITGVEVGLIDAFAREVDAEVRWVPGSESEVIAALELRTLHAVVGGLTADSPWEGDVALTAPYLTTRLVVGVPPGSPPLNDLEGLRVAVEFGSEAEGLLAEHDAVPVPIEEVEQADGPVAVEDWALEDLGLRDSGIELHTSDHVLAVPPGENALLTNLDQFLTEADPLTARLLREAEPQ